jgi:hypothetical protein
MFYRTVQQVCWSFNMVVRDGKRGGESCWGPEELIGAFSLQQLSLPLPASLTTVLNDQHTCCTVL